MSKREDFLIDVTALMCSSLTDLTRSLDLATECKIPSVHIISFNISGTVCDC